MPRRPTSASRSPPIYRASTRSGRRIERPRTMSSVNCCRSPSSPPFRPRAAVRIQRQRLGQRSGCVVSWEAVDFGLRGAGVRGAEAAVARARADESLTRLEVQSAVGAAFLAVVQAEQTVAATQADVERRDVLARAARTLADNQLRPGAEASRADAERAAAQTRSILARQALVLAQTTLTRVLGVTTGPVTRELDQPAGDGAGGGRAEWRGERAPPGPGSSSRRRPGASTGGRARAHEPPTPLPAVERLCAREWRECRWSLRWWRRWLGARARELGGRRPGGLPQRIRIREPACAAGLGRRLHARGERPLRRGATHRDQRAAGRGSSDRRCPRGGREHACPTGSRTAKRGAGQGPL